MEMDEVTLVLLNLAGLEILIIRQYDRNVVIVLLKEQKSVMMVIQVLEMGVMDHEQLSQDGLVMETVQHSDKNVVMEYLKGLKRVMMETLILGMDVMDHEQ